MLPPVVPISAEDYEQAVSALVAMIGQWWARQHQDDDPARVAAPAESRS